MSCFFVNLSSVRWFKVISSAKSLRPPSLAGVELYISTMALWNVLASSRRTSPRSTLSFDSAFKSVINMRAAREYIKMRDDKGSNLVIQFSTGLAGWLGRPHPLHPLRYENLVWQQIHSAFGVIDSRWLLGNIVIRFCKTIFYLIIQWIKIINQQLSDKGVVPLHTYRENCARIRGSCKPTTPPMERRKIAFSTTTQ